MALELYLSTNAERGLVRILGYVEERFDASTAIRVLERIEAAFPLLQENPSLGHRREDICGAEDVFFWPVGPSLLAYRVKEDRLEILAIDRASRDWASLFD